MTFQRSLLLLAAAATLSIVPKAHADDASKKAKVNELLTTLKLDQIGNRLEQQIFTQVSQHALQGVPQDQAAAQKPAFDAYTAKLKENLDGALGWPVLQPKIAKIYFDNFTEPELGAILEFYKSPAGQKMLANEPVVAEASQKAVNAQIEGVKPTIIKQTDDFIASVKKAAPPTLTPRTGSPAATPAPAPAPTPAPAPAPTPHK